MSYTTIEPQRDGYWTADKMSQYIKTTITEGEKRFPGSVLCFFFDHSSNHKALGDDCLKVSKVCLGVQLCCGDRLRPDGHRS